MSRRTDHTLHMLCRDGTLEQVKDYVEKLDEKTRAEKLFNKFGVFNYTPLHEAVVHGRVDVLDYLLQKTDDSTLVNCQGSSGFTPLHLAASSGDLPCARKLLEHKADVSIPDDTGKTPIQTAAISCKHAVMRLLITEGEYYLEHKLQDLYSTLVLLF